jgi:hypothetical protein
MAIGIKLKHNTGEITTGTGNLQLGAAGNLILDYATFPSADGTNTHVLSTDGAGNLSWVAQSGGSVTLSGLTDTNITTPAANALLQYDGANWIDAVPTTAHITEGANLYYTDARVDTRIGAASIMDLSDVVSTSINSYYDDYALTWDAGNSRFRVSNQLNAYYIRVKATSGTSRALWIGDNMASSDVGTANIRSGLVRSNASGSGTGELGVVNTDGDVILEVGNSNLSDVIFMYNPGGGTAALNGQTILSRWSNERTYLGYGRPVKVTGGGTDATQSELHFEHWDGSSANNGNYVGFRGPSGGPASNIVWKLPNADGSAGQLLKTDGSGVLSWVTDAGGIALTDLSVTTASVGTAALAYNNGSGVFTYTPPNLSSYLTSETSHADVVVDGDFASQGIMLRGGSAGVYSILTDASANWNTAFGWGDHASGGYLTSIAANSINDTHIDWGTGANQVSTADIPENTNLYYTDVRADARITNAGSANWNTAFGWGDHASGGYLTSTGALSSHTDVTISGPSSGQHLTYNGAAWVNATVSAASAAGSDTYVQFNDGGNMGADAGLTYAKATDTLTAGTFVTQGASPTVTAAGAMAITTTAGNGGIDLDPHGSGQVVFKGNATRGAGQFKLNCEANTHGITIKGPPHSAAANYTLTLPTTDGNAGEVLSTDGSGNLSWITDDDTPAGYNNSNWDTAFGWGDHGSGGYLTSIAANSINDTHIDWGTGSNQVSTADVPEQTNLYYTDVRADARIVNAGSANWNTAYTHAVSAHAPSGAEANEYSFKTITVSGQSDVVADTTTDALTFVAGSNMTITTSGDTITLAASGGGGGIALTDLSVTTGSASGAGTLAYNNSTGVFTYQPADLSSYLTSIDLNSLSAAAIDTATDSIAFIDANDSNNTKKESIADVLTAIAGTNLTAVGGVLNASGGGGGGDTFKTITVSGQSDVVADSTTDTLTLVAGSNVTLTTNAGADSVTIAASGGGGGTVDYEEFKCNYATNGSISTISNLSSGISSVNIDSAAGGDVTVNFTGYTTPPLQMIFYGYGYASNVYNINSLGSTGTTLRQLPGGGSSGSPTAFGSFANLQIRITEAITGASRSFGTTTHAWIRFVMGA